MIDAPACSHMLFTTTIKTTIVGFSSHPKIICVGRISFN